MSKKFKSPSEEVWAILKEVSKQQKLINKQQKLTDEQIKRTSEEVKKTSEQQKKTDKQMEKDRKEMQKNREQMEKDRKKNREKMEKNREQMEKDREKDRKALYKAVGDLGNSFGQLGENLVRGHLAERLKERGIEVEQVVSNLKNEKAEFDFVAINGKEIVVVELKSKIGLNDVKKFLSVIKDFKGMWPRLTKGKKVYGAMAFFVSGRPLAIDRAKKEGFFVISATGDVIIKNKKNFQPRAFIN